MPKACSWTTGKDFPTKVVIAIFVGSYSTESCKLTVIRVSAALDYLSDRHSLLPAVVHDLDVSWLRVGPEEWTCRKLALLAAPMGSLADAPVGRVQLAAIAYYYSTSPSPHIHHRRFFTET